ncbi:MAG: tetratricopeptide repeat protein [Acidobacteriota bacterium]
MLVQDRQSSTPPSRLLLAAAMAVVALATQASGTMRPRPTAKLTAGHTINGWFDARSEQQKTGEQARMVIFQPVFDPNQTITIDVESEQFNARLRLLDSAGKVLAEDEDSGIGHNARLLLPAKQFNLQTVKDLCLELTSQGSWDIGRYTITLTYGEAALPQGKDKIKADITYCEHAATLALANRAYRRQGWALATMAWNYGLLGHYDKLREQALMAKKLAEQTEDQRLLASALKDIGAAAWYQGHPEDAIPYFQQALEIRRKLGDRKGESNSLDNLGIAYQQLGQHQRAIECFEQSLKLCRDSNDRRGEGNELGNLGITYYIMGDHNRAIEFYEQALQIRREVGDRRGEAYDLGNLGVVYAKLGEYQRAIVYYELAIKIRREVGDRRGEGRDLGNLAKACVRVGDMQRAVEYNKESQRIQEELSNSDQ